jgi:hypothetical protein
MKKEILKLTGLTESQFYEKYPTQAAFEADYPEMKLGGTPEAFPQIATADNFFSYGVPVPPTYYMHGGPTVYPQIQTEAQFFSPVYSNSNNAYAVGGSYMEAYPQAKVYPQGPVGGSSFYMMQDGGQGMPEPQKDQTFYTQKMNSFFDKLRQAAYKNLQNGIMNSEPDTTSAMPELGMGRKGGMLSYQGNTSTGQTTTPAAAAATPTATNPNYQTVTTADGQTFIVGPNNQLYSPFKGNQTTTTNTQQQQRVNPYPYMNRNGVYVGTGLDNVANWLIPNNQREQYRNIREQQGLGIGDLTPEQLKAIQSGAANVADITYETRRALFPKNRLKSVNIKFRNPVTGQMQATTTDAASANATTNPAATTTTSATSPATTTTTASTTNPAAATTTPAATTQAAPKDVELDDGSYVTADEAKAKGYTQNPDGSWSKASTAASATPQQDVNAVVAKMQADARAKGMSVLSPEDSELEYQLPADERMRMQSEKNAIDEQFKNYDNYKKMRDMQIRQGMTPDEFDFNRNYDYQSKSASPQSAPPTSLDRDYISNSNYPDLDEKFTGTNMTQRERLLQQLNSNDPKEVEYAKYRIGAMQDWDAMQVGRNKKSQAPSNINSMDSNAAKKKAGMKNPNTYINQDYIDAVRNQARGAKGLPPVNVQAPADTIDTTTWPGSYAAPGTPKYDGSENFPFRMGGPYVLPMYQGMVGPSQVDTSQLYGPTTDQFNFDQYNSQDDEFEIGLNFGRTKKTGVNEYLPAWLRAGADYITNSQDAANANQYITQSSRANNTFRFYDQDQGDYTVNNPAAADLRPNKMVPVGNTGAGYREAPAISQYGGPMMFDIADLFFLTPQMLKKTTSRR